MLVSHVSPVDSFIFLLTFTCDATLQQKFHLIFSSSNSDLPFFWSNLKNTTKDYLKVKVLKELCSYTFIKIFTWTEILCKIYFARAASYKKYPRVANIMQTPFVLRRHVPNFVSIISDRNSKRHKKHSFKSQVVLCNFINYFLINKLNNCFY